MTDDAAPQRPRILVVDDDPSIVDLLEAFLQDDYEVLIAAGGEQAIAACRRRQPDLMLLDVMMPGLDGYEVCRRLKADPATREVPVIFVTARAEIEEEVRGLEAGAVDFISKPVHRAIVRARVRTHVVLRQQAAKLRDMAMTDILTGVANRRSIEERIESEWRRCRRSRSPIAIIMIDIDHFKLYNDAYGHQAGDNCLEHIASALRRCLRRAGDLLGRYGGEEFICLLPETTLEHAVQKADELGRAVRDLNIVHARDTGEPVVTISRGVSATIPRGDEEPADLLQVADAMLYDAKRAGRNRTAAAPLGPAATPDSPPKS
jgi:diguanylate cyclase (GGDEF)-like protein